MDGARLDNGGCGAEAPAGHKKTAGRRRKPTLRRLAMAGQREKQARRFPAKVIVG